jgi:monoamine oxidase
MSLAKVADVAVVGGGISGLMASYILETSGLSTVVLESDVRFGGRIRTLHYGRANAEAGAQELWNGTEPMTIARQFGLPLESEPAISSVFAKGTLFAIDRNQPEAYLQDIFSPADFRSFKACRSKIPLSLRRASIAEGSDVKLALRNTSFLQWLQALGVTPKVLEWMKMTIEPELAAPFETVSALSGLHVANLFLQPGRFAARIVAGNSRLVDAFWSRRRGSRLEDATVTEINLGSDGLSTVTFLRQDSRNAIRARRVLVTVPWYRLGNIQFSPPLPEDILGQILALGRGGYTVVHLECDGRCAAISTEQRESFPILTGDYLGVLYCPKRIGNPLILSVLQYGEPALAFQHEAVNALRRTVIERLDVIFPGISKEIKGAMLFPYYPAGVPFWPPGRSPMDEWGRRMLEPLGGVYFAGDYLFGGQLQGAVQSARVQSRAIIRDLRVTRPRRSF